MTKGAITDLAHIPGKSLNDLITLYIKLQEELLKVRKISQTAIPSRIYRVKILADFYDEKIEIAKHEKALTEEDRRYKIAMLEKAKAKHVELL